MRDGMSVNEEIDELHSRLTAVELKINEIIEKVNELCLKKNRY